MDRADNSARICVTAVGRLDVHSDVDWRFDLVNAINGRLPLETWRSRVLLRARERAAKALGLGDLQLSGLTPAVTSER